MRQKVNIYLFSETKLDETFPNQPIKIYGYKVYRRGRNKNGSGVLCYVDENIPCKMISVEGVPANCEIILIEFSIKTRKRLCIGLYKLPSQMINIFLTNCHLL